LSVVIPARDVALTLPMQLAALEQASDDLGIEVIVADNGSVDATRSTAASFRGRIDVRIVDASRAPGINVARNEGVRASRSEHIVLCDGDDEVDARWLRSMHRELDKGADLVGGPIDYRRLNTATSTAWRGATRSEPERWHDFLPSPHGANCGFTRTAFDAIEGFDERYQRGGDDLDFFWRAQLAGFRFTPVPDAVVHYRLRDSYGPLWHQFRGYGASEVLLYRRFRHHGLRRRALRDVGATSWWLASRLPFAIGRAERRGTWLRVAATTWGRMVGSARYRVLYL